MKISLHHIPVRDLVAGYADNGDGGVVGYDGRLDIRPSFQREFIYQDAQRDAVLATVLGGFPLNSMYWNVASDGRFEVLDGQQRTISLAQYVVGDFSIMVDGYPRNFGNLPPNLKDKILDYPLTVYVCEGTDEERLAWFRVINISGAKLTDQELRNAVYAGPWLTEAKRYFSRPGCPAYGLASRYMSGSPIRQDYLEAVLGWVSGGSVEVYMADHQHDPTAAPLWLYFQKVFAWVEAVFPAYYPQMKGRDWGRLYNTFGSQDFDPAALGARIAELFLDDDVTSKGGIFEYVLGGDEKHLSLRSFSPAQKLAGLVAADYRCARCGAEVTAENSEADHIDPWSAGGKTTADNLQILCKPCNRRKSNQ